MTAKKSHIHVNMSNSPAYTGAQSPLLVGQALEDISQRDNIETEMLQKEQETLSALQVTLSDVQKNSDEAEKKLKCKVRDLLIMEDDMIHLEQKMQAGRDCCASITAEKTKLLEQIIEEEEKACMARAQFDIYQRKMEGHRQAVLNVVGQTDICMQEKRALVQELRNAKEELKEDLKNPKGNRVQTAKREIDTLKREIGVMRENIAQRREDQQKVLETHAQIKKEIESQNKRFEAISKHLHCQIIKAQAVHRQMSRDIYHMERQKAELQRQLESSNYSAQC
ncbi:coiled-coil domain-containing protein 122-like isoform X1 [Phyllopteryx taeniolatus]|uniref:coiled-coil domain-containing protein 122-like isoform X1 n=1 Tax=Phyllopteryx taeniolatus TaxID=161469 RepID=UPI002AD26724|nr:coiled-coil domain-containing protein 122-like isoform X1 [Phyllopteryx taeniolatus]